MTKTLWRRSRRLSLLVLIALAACGGNDTPAPSTQTEPAVELPTQPMALNLKVLSSRPDMVSSDSALIEIAVPAGTVAADIKLSANGTDVSSMLASVEDGKRLRGLITGLAPTDTKLVAEVAGDKAYGTLTVTNHPRTGPLFSGPQLTPFECRTTESGLGAPLDSNCSVTTRYDWFYFTPGSTTPIALADPLAPRPGNIATATTINGKSVPFIIRVESGTINRSIYRIAVLDDPTTAGVWNPAGWNRRVVFRFGESTAAQYNQGKLELKEVYKNDATDPQSIKALERGFAYVVSSLNINKVNVNDVVAAETAMMIREHITKTYGVPRWMVGMGGSGGAIQQMLIAQNYPGILDGIMPDAAFPDVFGTALAVSDCRLLNRHFTANPASDAVRKAFEGHLKNICAAWDAGNGDAILATSGSVSPACGLNDASKVYNPLTNPTGARCTAYDINVNTLGRNAFTGAANRPLDNVGIQYGLASLKKGQITAAEFLDANEKIGGYDADGNITTQRTVGDLDALKVTYEKGRIGSGSGGLATVPILHVRAYTEPGPDIHTIYNDIKIREQLMRANGRADNQVIWLLPHPSLGVGGAQQLMLAGVLYDTFLQRLDLMTQWLDNIAADPAPASTDKVARLKPAEATDSCWNLADGKRIKETASLDAAGSACNALYPKSLPPRMVAGSPVSDDVIKCQLKPISDSDYLPVAFTLTEKIRLTSIFPNGTCDYSKPGVGQTVVKGTWLKY